MKTICRTGGRTGFSAFALACALIAPALAKDRDNAIVPGRRIGKVVIGASETTLNALGKSDCSDGKPASQWQTWFTKVPAATPNAIPAELDICAESRPGSNGRFVQAVRITSSYFTLSNGIKVGSSFARVKRAYPHLKRIDKYNTTESNGPIFLCDDIQRGIAFEFYRGRDGKAPGGLCVAISVHTPKSGVNDFMTRMTDHVSEAVGHRP